MTVTPPLQILLVDDDHLARFVLRKALLDSGYGVAEAADGEAALETYARVAPDLVLLDVVMPGMDGLEVCRRLSADAERRNVPILMLTAMNDLQTVTQAFEAGAADIISKPYNLSVVQQRVRRQIRVKQTEDAIRRAKREWEATLDAVSDMVLVTGPDDRVVRCNHAVKHYLRLGYDALLGRSPAELFYQASEAAPEFYQAEAGPLQFPRLPGWFLIRNYTVALDDHTQGAVHVLRDVTQPHELELARQAAVEALATRERQYRLLAEHMADVVWAYDTDQERFTYVSPSAESLTGYAVEEWLSLNLQRLLTPEAFAQVRVEWLARVRAIRAGTAGVGGHVGEFLLRRKDGSTVWAEISTSYIRTETGMIEVVGVTRDITERKRAAEALATQARVLEEMAEGVNVSNAAGRIVFTNRAFDDMFGYARNELVGQSVAVLNDLPPAENAAFLADLRTRMETHGRWIGELANRRKDGTPFTTVGRASPVTFFGERCWVTVQTDITEQKQTQAWLLNAQKLADLGTLAAGVAHELNSPLQVITGVSQSLLRRQTAGTLEPDYLCRNLDVIQRNGWRCAEIVRSLHTYARVSSGQLASTDLNEVVRDTLLLIEHQLRSWSNVAVVTELTPDLPSLQCDRNQLVQVLINLLTNARDAMPEGGEITVQTSADAGRLYLRVSDTGAGIPDSIRPKLFDPFFTTKPIGKGTGLGLSIVAGIVRAYGGEISVDSAVGRGTTFSIHFPVTVPAGSGGAYLGEPAPEAQLVGRFDDFSQALPELPGRG